MFNVPGYGDPGAALLAFSGNNAERYGVNTLANNPAGLQNVVRGGCRVVAGSNLNEPVRPGGVERRIYHRELVAVRLDG